MNTNDKHIDYDALIAKHLSGEITSKETEVLNAWLELDENRKYFDDLENIWKAAEADDSQWVPDEHAVDQAWEKVKPRREFRIFRLQPVLAVAASIALLVVLYFIFSTGPVDEKTLIAESDPVNIDLSDGSLVELEPHSKLTYTETFEDDERLVKLEGKARFEVEADPQKPFRVSASSAFVEVLGTQFKVDQEADSVFVEVFEGKVGLYHKDQRIELSAGESGFWRGRDELVMKLTTEREEQSTLNTFDLEFDERRMEEVLLDLQMQYGVNFEWDPAFSDCLFSGKFTQATLGEILETIAIVYNVEIDSFGQNVIITGDGC